MKRVSVVILNWNGVDMLRKFMPSVIDNSVGEGIEICVADNASSDGSLEMLRSEFPVVRLIELDQNYGFAEGYNRALAQVDAEYVVLLNSDVEVTSHWLEPLLDYMDTHSGTVACQPKLLSWHNKEYFEYAGAAGGYMDIYGYPYCRGRVLHIVEKDNGQYDTPADILWATGACLFIRTAIYKEVGGLDAGFFAHQEEIDMCWRLRSRGYRLVCTPGSVVYHVGGATLQVESPRKTFLNFRNNLLMIYKNLSEKDLKHVMRARFFLDYIAATKFLLCGHIQNAKAVYEARKAFFEMKPVYVVKRKENLAKTTLATIPELMRNSLILSFYLKGKKKFTDL